jgi:F-type H+-transporting ATPase subunit delta
MTSSAVTSRYAGALADVVTGKASPRDPQETLRELREFAAALAESPELRVVMASPAVPGSRKRAVIGRICDKLGLSRVVRNFLFVLVDHRRMDALTEITEHFEIQLDERLGFQRAEITSAAALDESQRADLVRQLAGVTGKQVRPKYAVDANLIGGVVARVGSTVYDGSVRGRLRALERRLAGE